MDMHNVIISSSSPSLATHKGIANCMDISEIYKKYIIHDLHLLLVLTSEILLTS